MLLSSCTCSDLLLLIELLLRGNLFLAMADYVWDMKCFTGTWSCMVFLFVAKFLDSMYLFGSMFSVGW